MTMTRKACTLGIRRPHPMTRTNKRFIHPIIRELRRVREWQGMTRAQLATRLGHPVGQILGWELGKTKPVFYAVYDWARSLGFDLVLKETGHADKVVIAWPSREKMMAGR